MNEVAFSELTAVIPDLVVEPNALQIFSFSAVTWNRHRIHYDKDAAIAEGHKHVVVQRALLGNFLAALLENWLGERGAVRKLSWKVLSSALPDQPLRCHGTALIERNVASCELTIESDQGDVIAKGKAECLLEEG